MESHDWALLLMLQATGPAQVGWPCNTFSSQLAAKITQGIHCKVCLNLSGQTRGPTAELPDIAGQLLGRGSAMACKSEAATRIWRRRQPGRLSRKPLIERRMPEAARRKSAEALLQNQPVLC